MHGESLLNLILDVKRICNFLGNMQCQTVAGI